jgi:nitroimidazol reductase NimA-like FMN-containing flavoprotein (pyridoxamine 5'-phosphate oxidase superfamily)
MTDKKGDAQQGVEHLTTTECWRLLESVSLGRLAVEGPEGIPDVFPVNFTVHSGSVYLRSAPGS